MICIGSKQSPKRVEIEHMGDCWELRMFSPKDTTHRLSSGRPGEKCRKKWYGKLEQAISKAVDIELSKKEVNDLHSMHDACIEAKRAVIQALNEHQAESKL